MRKSVFTSGLSGPVAVGTFTRTSSIEGLIHHDPIGAVIGAQTEAQEIAREWDLNAGTRARELEQDVDETFRRVLVPNILRLLANHSQGPRILDIGCGLGFLSHAISGVGYRVDAVDFSRQSVEYARSHFPDVQFELAEIGEFTAQHKAAFDSCVANMVFHGSPNIDRMFGSVYGALRRGGTLVMTIPHPFLWAIKRSIAPQVVENYLEEQVFKVPFKIRNGTVHPSLVTYFHRPLESYVNALVQSGFAITDLSLLPSVKPDISVIIGKKPR